MKLVDYMQDGAHAQPRAVLMLLQEFVSRLELEEFRPQVQVGRWENCREQGYVVYIDNKEGKQLNVAFFQHRNTDSLCCVKWLQKTVNAPHINDSRMGAYEEDKWAVDASFNYGEVYQCAEWIYLRIQEHLEEEGKE